MQDYQLARSHNHWNTGEFFILAAIFKLFTHNAIETTQSNPVFLSFPICDNRQIIVIDCFWMSKDDSDASIVWRFQVTYCSQCPECRVFESA